MGAIYAPNALKRKGKNQMSDRIKFPVKLRGVGRNMEIVDQDGNELCVSPYETIEPQEIVSLLNAASHLPVTADGVRINLETQWLYTIEGKEITPEFISSYGVMWIERFMGDTDYHFYETDKLYSTPEAAQKAREK